MGKILASLTLAAGLSALTATEAFAEGEVGGPAYTWIGYKALDSISYPGGAGLGNFQGKVVLLVLFQYNCGGCVANAPRLGKLADSLGSGQAGVPFQALGAEIDNGTFAQIQTSYNVKLKQNAPNVKFPLVHVPFDTAIVTDGVGTKWKRYNSYRDVYFVINQNGIIRARIEGNRTSTMTTVKYDSLRTQLAEAISAATSVLPSALADLSGLRVFRRGSAYVFDPGAARGPVSLKIADLQGRVFRSLTLRGVPLAWDGKDAAGRPVPFGTYLVRASEGSTSSSLKISVLP